ncbi:MAG: CDF family Co(II)/Ni(II) efflux transporter DmeF [Chromatiales bacterium]|jgi:cation diffusion facilitator family transporter|nr:CDF family Co(II)/Ni(II) efflux transporter DmeF [Chromatiales bacterium]MDH4030575.1 CDF family Co(II)/Ni(II) efflux transporter DmeF [Chromatiales bacterium]
MNRLSGRHSHVFGQDRARPGESRTLVVIAITAAMMVVEVTAGIVYGSMALLADGLHMASHAVALSINAFAYVYARRRAHDEEFSFGTGKVNALGGFSGAILLALFSVMMAWESVARLMFPVPIVFDRAILVAIVGLAVNGASMFILGHQDHDHDHHEHDHHHAHGHDHNLRAAYLHVLADALTSLLAIFALLVAKYLGQVWMDPLMGIVGAVLVARWSLGLLRSTSEILLDRQGPRAARERIRESLEADGITRVTDLHLWCIGPGIYSLVIALATDEPRPTEDYRSRIPGDLRIVHANIEICATGRHDTG